MTRPVPTFWLPPDLGFDLPATTVTAEGRRETRLQLENATLERLCREMRSRREALAALPVARIVEALHEASRRWLDVDAPEYRSVLRLIARRTGMSEKMVAKAVRNEMASSLGPDLMAALRNELGDERRLDDFTYNPLLKGETFACGPELVGGIVSSNIPALPHLTVMRSLLVKAPCIVKTASSEPYFLPQYAQTLWEIDPAVARAVAVVSFGRAERPLLEAFLGGIDFLIAYGGLEAMQEIQARKPAGLRALLHGHKLGFGLFSREALAGKGLARLARAAAFDVVLYDQEACLAPHVFFVEAARSGPSLTVGARNAPPAPVEAARSGPSLTVGVRNAPPAPGEAVLFAEQLAAELGRLARTLPAGSKPLAQRLAIRQELDLLAMKGEGAAFEAGKLHDGLVVVQPLEAFKASPLGRLVRVVPVASLDDAIGLVEPLRGLLQNAAVAAPPERRRALCRRLARLGVSRVCPPGNMGTPTMMWHHDGHLCLAEMLRFSDWEVRGGQPPPLLQKVDEGLDLTGRLDDAMALIPEPLAEPLSRLSDHARRLLARVRKR